MVCSDCGRSKSGLAWSARCPVSRLACRMVIVLPKRDETSRVHRSTASWLLDRRHIQQLQVVNECLVLNGGKWCGHPLGDDHRTIRHDLQWANSIIPCHPAQFSASVVLSNSPPPLYSPPTLLPGPPSSTSCWSTAGQNRPHPTEVAEVLAHETERRVRLEEVSRHRQLTECAQGSRAVSRAVASAAAADPSAAGCGDAQRHQMAAADALLSMAAAEQQGVVQQHSVRTADRHHSTVDSPATPNQELNGEPPCVPMPPVTPAPSVQHAPAALPCLWNAPPSALQHRFQTLVMCNFTPRRPRELPTSRWVSLNTLYRLFEPHNRGEVWLMGPGNLKQLITKWYKDHPAFAGLAVEQWCRRFTRDEARAGVTVFKFCFEHKMPHEAATV